MKKRTGVLVVITLALIYTSVFYGKILIDPNAYLFNNKGDGMKGYYGFAYHIKHDTSFVNFKGMGYPYGENHFFVDGQTGLANSLKYFSRFYPGVNDHVIGIHNFLLILSFIPCAVLLYLIIRRLKMPEIYNIAGAIVFTFLSPQIFRLGGHFSLSYMFFFPLIWYISIRFFESEKRKWLFSLLLMLTGVVFGFLHAYYILICSLFLICYWLFWFIQNQKNAEHKKIINYIYFFIQAIIPLLVVKIYVGLTDFHPDRAVYPYGLFAYNARLNTIFIPHHPPFGDFFEWINLRKGQRWEGWAYVGLPSAIIAVVALFGLIKKIWKRDFNAFLFPDLPPVLKVAVPASTLLMFYALSFPYNAGLMFLPDMFPFLYQFRSLGRFAWPFFYVFTIFSLYSIYLISKQYALKNKHVLSVLIPTSALVIYFSEGISYHTSSSQYTEAPNEFNINYLEKDYRDAISKIDTSKYQAIISLPYFQIGNENFTREFTKTSIKPPMLISYHTGMSLVNLSSARSSISEGKKMMQLMAPSFIAKEYQKDLKSKKPFLVITNGEKLDQNETDFLLSSKLLYSNKALALYELSYDDFFKNTSSSEIDKFNSLKKILIPYNGFFVDSVSSLIFFDKEGVDFRNAEPTKVFKGSMGEEVFIIDKKKLDLKTGTEYVLSFWYYNKGELRNQNQCYIKELDRDGNEIGKIRRSASDFFHIDGDWTLVEIPFSIQDDHSMISVSMKSENKSGMPYYLHSLMIRKKDVLIYRLIESENSKSITKNNLFIAE